MKKNKVLITGANGFIGSRLVQRLLANEFEILALTYGDNQPEYPHTIVSLNNRAELERIFAEYRPSVVVHLAAIAFAVYANPAEVYNVNVCGTENLLAAAKKFTPGSRVILTSTAGVYGNQAYEVYNETLPFNPANHYSYSKMITEFISRFYQDVLDVSIVRPFNIIGSGQNVKFIVPKLVKHYAECTPSIELGNMDSVRDYVDVDYCISVIEQLIAADSVPDILNICTGIPHSGMDLLRILSELTGHYPEIIIKDTFVRNNEVWRMVGCNKRLEKFMNGRGAVAKKLEEVLKDMLATIKNVKNV
ncbi:MAG: GDP-mannose 4,6-dehydratase [Campylobacteraceae bacterium]|jgi:nucleoside-diphosphate-sugar epimerase|nr:GDP-mannose 4,6-dehydratase [Campylobacteraceae bacterium]